jgi:hypothetical protein
MEGVSDMDIKEIREALDKLDKEKTYSDAFVGACLSCYLSSEEQYEAINKAKQEYENNKVSSALHANFPSYCRFLLSEVERLEDKKAEMQVTIEDCKVEINKKWEDHSKLVIGLKDAVKNGNQRCAKLEKENADYHKIISEILKCDPVPACKREDNKLEPPWEVISRIRKENAALREELKLSHDVVEAAKEAIVCVGFADLMATCQSVRKEFEPIRNRLLEALKKIKED